MTKIFKLLALILFGGITLTVLGTVYFFISYKIQSSNNLSSVGELASNLIENGYTFRDLNKNGKLDIYEDARQTVEDRVADILGQMTLEEKAGMLFMDMIAVGKDGELLELPHFGDPISLLNPINSEMVVTRKMNHFNVLEIWSPEVMATWANKLQRLAERTRLGIPVTIASDPRHASNRGVGVANLQTPFLSSWCEPIGFAAIGDSATVAEFGHIARQEYRALGIHLALHPMADLATEPRWPRIPGTFGEDAELSARMTAAYIKGFQGDSITATSVACMTKHFSGGGPQKDGLDPHLAIGKEQVYPGENFDYHLIPFEKGAFPAGTAQIMPYYGIPMGQTDEDVGFNFNKKIIRDLLRNRYGFDGVVCSDWSILTDKTILKKTITWATAWGVEDLTKEERALKALNAGIDQFGGENIPGVVIELVNTGAIKESRIDESVRRLLRDKFRLGLFDQPYVSEEKAPGQVGKPSYKSAGLMAQKKSMVLLKNSATSMGKMLPLKGKPAIYIDNINPNIASKYGEIVENIEDADVALIRIETPFEIIGEGVIAEMLHQGDLDFKKEEKERILNILNTVPTIVDVYMDRPAVMPEIAAKSAGLFASFNVSDKAFLEVAFGKFKPIGKLPFELPSSMEAVEKQFEDVPYDSKQPLYPFGHGLEY